MVDFGGSSTDFYALLQRDSLVLTFYCSATNSINNAHTSCLRNVNYLSPSPSMYPTIDITAKERV